MSIIVANLLIAVGQVIGAVLGIFQFLILARIIISWIRLDPYNQIVQTIFMLTEPVLYRVRRYTYKYTGQLDFSPLIVFLAIFFLQTFLVNSMIEYGAVLKSASIVRP